MEKIGIEGKTALVVGAGRGIGRQVAELFSAEGANVAVSSRTLPELLELEYKLNSHGNPNVLAIAADASNISEAEMLIKDTEARFGGIDYLIISAGAGLLKPFGETKAEDLQGLFEANVKTAFNILRAALPGMAERKFGRVVAFPGILGKAPMMQASAYCAAKYALTGMIKCLSQEYRRQGIRFSLMHFGGVDSSFWDNISAKVQRDKMLSIKAAAQAAFFAAAQEGEGVMAEVVLMPENHQLV